MLRSNVTKSIAAAAVSFFAAHATTAQEVKNLPADATAHFIYFPTGGYKLDAKDQDQIRDVAGMIQSHPDFVATILGKTDSVGSVRFNERLSQRRANAVFEALVMTTKCQRTGYKCAGPASACHSHQPPIKPQRRRTGWLRLS
jgi:outer membrane protein OmpA-like peptidoglycan-associated protein